MDWFHEWPRDALINVASRFLAEIDFPKDELRGLIAEENQYLGNVEDIQAENDEELENLFKDYSMIEDIYAACDLAEDSAENDSELNA